MSDRTFFSSKLAGRGATKTSKLLLTARPSHTGEHSLVLQEDVLGSVVPLSGLRVCEDQSEEGAIAADLRHLPVEHLAGSEEGMKTHENSDRKEVVAA